MTFRKFGLLLGVLLLSGCSWLPQEPDQLPLEISTPITTKREITTVEQAPIEVRIPLSVTFGSAREQALYTRANGRLRAVHVTAGQRVATGELMLELESGGLKYDVARAELTLKRRQMSLEAAQARIGFTDAPSTEDLDRAELDIEEARLALAQAQENLANTQIVAPFAGVVSSIAVLPGEQIEAFKPLVVLSADGNLVARAKVDQSTAARLQVNQVAHLFPNDGNPLPLTGTVAVVPAVGTVTGGGELTITLDQQSERVKVGQGGRAEVVAQRKEAALVIPKSAVKSFGGRQFVTTVRGETRQEISIKTGLENATHVEVLEGLKVGDQVISR